jgi:hypothetical protein
MDDSLGVCPLDRVRDVLCDRLGLIQRDGALFQPVGQGRPDDQLHHQIAGSDIVEMADIRMIQRSYGSCFSLEEVGERLRAVSCPLVSFENGEAMVGDRAKYGPMCQVSVDGAEHTEHRIRQAGDARRRNG